ncbi:MULTISPECIES: helix-turn-helix domain-containing protein [Phyllobacteriaceae]|uniref:Chromosomal replication initiator DnaA C-terminal domain-containing protein n=1 Tax=Phyllobacterium phragmitis TaxID=2670329 RepID=A0ABQ0GXH1_9HYPH|nr:helix-turn-helix domain-containing protein [Mesorhizobium sp. RMAD-H1]MBB2970122.1 chromosomal replication initiation ATPase DnaA [Mesorhizobium sp. RMAD-H1]
MSSVFSGVIHTRSEAVDALVAMAVKHGRCVVIDKPSVGEGRRRNLPRVRMIEACDAFIDILAAYFGVPGSELRSCDRCRREIARVRQIGMYVAHTLFGMTMTEVAQGFARDRSTVMHACHLIEDMREDREFDAILAAFERLSAATFLSEGRNI